MEEWRGGTGDSLSGCTDDWRVGWRWWANVNRALRNGAWPACVQRATGGQQRRSIPRGQVLLGKKSDVVFSCPGKTFGMFWALF